MVNTPFEKLAWLDEEILFVQWCCKLDFFVFFFFALYRLVPITRDFVQVESCVLFFLDEINFHVCVFFLQTVEIDADR